MTIVDWMLLGLIALSVVLGLVRGFIREAFALLIWAAAFVLAFYFSGATANLLEGVVEVPSVRTGLAFGGIFLLVLVVGALLNWVVGKLVEKTGLSGTDRLLGAVFGAARGLLLVVALIIVAGFSPVTQDPWWSESRVIQSLLPLADWAATYLPDSVREFLDLYGQKQAVQVI